MTYRPRAPLIARGADGKPRRIEAVGSRNGMHYIESRPVEPGPGDRVLTLGEFWRLLTDDWDPRDWEVA